MENDKNNDKIIQFNRDEAIPEQDDTTNDLNESSEQKSMDIEETDNNYDNVIAFQKIQEQAGSNVMQNSDTDEEKADDGSDDYIPTAIIQYRQKQFFLAGLLAGISLLCCLVFRSFSPTVFLIGTVYYAHVGMNAVKMYKQGEIYELAAICSGTKPGQIKNRTMVTFRVELDDGGFTYFKFYLPGKKVDDDFIVNAPYVIYFSKNNPQYLISYVLI